MDEKTGKKVLIVGASAGEYTLAKKMSESDEISEVFVAPGNDAMKEFCNVVDIRENSIQELLEFALENAIDLTIASSEEAIKNDIASIFQQNNQMIFAPAKESANICLYKSAGKKFMYRNRIPCSKFGIFDKPSMAIEYVKKSNMPIVIKTDEAIEKGILVCNNVSMAKNFIENLFDNGENKVVIEDYVPGHGFSFYVITDGYHALPLGSVATYKYELEGNGGFLGTGIGAFTPDYKVSKQVERKILQQIIYPALNTLSREQTPYIGILGVDLVIDDSEQIFTLKFNSFLRIPDCQGILSLLNENLYNLFQACVIGSFADDYEQLDILDKSAVSCVLSSNIKETIINGLDDLDESTEVAHFYNKKNRYLEYETTGGKTLVITKTARILSKAIEDLYDEISVIKFDGMKYRKDIGQIY